MNGLYQTGNSAPFTRFIRVVPQQDIIRITNRTLDGQLHVQTIGNPVTNLIIETQVDNTGRAILESLSANMTTFTIECDEGTYTGRIMELGTFSKPIRGHYRTTLTVAV